MARTFSKNLSNYAMVTTQRNAIGNLLNGASKIAAHCWFKYASTATSDLRDYIFSFPIQPNAEGLGLGIQYNGGNRRLRARARSSVSDGGQLKIGNTNLSSGTGYYGGAIWDIGADTIEVFLNGASDGSGGVTFVNSAWTLGSFAGSGVDLESIGCVCGTSGSAPTNTDQSFDGDIAELAIWAGSAVPSAADFAALGAGVSPRLIFPSTLVAYWPLLGDASPERELFNRNEGVITGSIPLADHPRMYYPRPTMYSFASGSGAYTLTAAKGDFSLSGQAAALKAARKITADQGAFTLTGQAAALKVGRKVTAAQGSFALTGQAATLKATRTVSAVGGSFTLTGQAAGLRATRLLSAAYGSFTFTGQSANLVKGSPGAYTLTASYGAFTLSGQSVSLVAARQLAAGQGAFALTGQAAGLSVTRRLVAACGSFTLTGQAASLLYSGEVVGATIYAPVRFHALQVNAGAAPQQNTNTGAGKRVWMP